MPYDLVNQKELLSKRILLYLFLAIKHGMDNSIVFSVNMIILWSKLKPNRHKGKTNDQFKTLIKEFVGLGYLIQSCNDNISDAMAIEYQINETMFSPVDRYSMIYLDEIYKILNYKSYVSQADMKDTTVGAHDILLVLLYLRFHIGKRNSNGTNGMTEEEHRKSFSEAWQCFYEDIAPQIGIGVKNVSKSLKILRDLKILYFDDLTYSLFVDKNDLKDKRKEIKILVRTNQTIFANYYKRVKKWISNNYYQIEEYRGSEYYMAEIKSLKEKVDNNNRKYYKRGGG